MKKCPYCAEEIKDEAIKCRYCLSWLVDEIPAGAETPPAGLVAAPEPAAQESAAPQPETVQPEMGEPSTAPTQQIPAQAAPTAGDRIEFTHSGERYLLGYARDYFGIWDRQSPALPAYRFPRSDQGWVQAWQKYVAIESNYMDLRTGQR